MVLAVVIAALASALCCYLIVRHEAVHLAVTGDRPRAEKQKVHVRIVPRIGGAGIMIGLLAAAMAASLLGVKHAPFLWAMLVVCLPAFAGGIAEDLTRQVGPTPRLLMTMVSAAIAFVWLDAHLYRSHMPWLDAALSYWVVSFGATCFAVAGVAHSMNIIDGYNGLAAGVGAMILMGMGVAAGNVGDWELALVCFVTAAAYVGFLMLNYPFGRIFLGDGGAYLLGTLIAVLAALLVARNPAISPWFPLALVIYPVWETIFSMGRRVMQRISVGTADARHLHSLVYRRLMLRFFPSKDPESSRVRNALTALPLWGVQAIMVLCAVPLAHWTRMLQFAALALVLIYCGVYFWLLRMPRPPRAEVQRYLLARSGRS